MSDQKTWMELLEAFDLGPGRTDMPARIGIGHINDTFAFEVRRPAGGAERFIVQRINRAVFPDVDGLMENVRRVTALQSGRSLRLVPTKAGGSYHRDEAGECWRAFPFIENTVTRDRVSTTEQAAEAGRAYGRFARSLADLPEPRLFETIPDFHHTPKRLAAFEAAADADPLGRAARARAEIDAAMAGADWAGAITDALADGRIPERTAHNDAKIENVLFDARTGEAVCVVDLDTVMPGTPLHDFGDLVRTAPATASEDEADLLAVGFSMEILDALARGFLSGCGDMLTKAEIELLPLAGKIITYEQALRFLTDYLLGDPYYRTSRAEHNLERARNQLRLAELLDQAEEEITRAIRAASRR